MRTIAYGRYMKSPRLFEYDVAFSFAGEDRVYVAAVANILREKGVRVFYDLFEQASLWGKDLYGLFDEIYRLKAQYCLMFISTNYVSKAWTSHERRSAQARAIAESREYILPVRLDEAEVPGLLPTTSYVNAAGIAPAVLADLVIEKLKLRFEVARKVGLFFEIGSSAIVAPGDLPEAARLLSHYCEDFGSIECQWASVNFAEPPLRDAAKKISQSGFRIAVSRNHGAKLLLERIAEESIRHQLDVFVLLVHDSDFLERIRVLLSLGKTVRLIWHSRQFDHKPWLVDQCLALHKKGEWPWAGLCVETLGSIVVRQAHNTTSAADG